MRPIRSLLAAAVLTSALFCGVAAPPALAQIYQPQRFTLKNGLEVIVLENHRAPVVTQMLWYRVGGADEEPGKAGLAHFLEHMMFKGTKTVPSGAFSAEIARHGGRENAFTTHDATVYFQDIARDQLPLIMRLEADRMNNLKLAEQEFVPEKQVILEERRMRVDNNPGAMLGEQMMASLFLSSPYHHPVIGWMRDVETLKLEDLRAFYRRWYAPNNATLIITGDTTVAEVRRLAEQSYGVIPAHPLPPRPSRAEVTPPTAERALTLHHSEVHQPNWSRIYQAPSLGSGERRDTLALELLAQIVGQGPTSRLYQALVRQQKLAASVEASYSRLTLGPSGFEISLTPNPGVPLAQARDAALAVLADLRDKGVTDAELQRARRRLTDSVTYSRESLRAGAYAFGQTLSIGGTTEDVEHWPQHLEKITVADINAVARAVLNEKASVSASLLPEDKDAAAAEQSSPAAPAISPSLSEVR